MTLTADLVRGGHARRRAWTGYWQTGVLHSCPTSYSGNYEGAIGEFWCETARRLPAHGHAIDLATGNGAIPRLLLSHGRVDLDIDAIDAADVLNPKISVDAGIRFHSCVQMEMLPFPPSCFDAACSQFGIEYANHPEALEEVLRVLRSTGQIHWVIHHRDSIFTRVAALESEHLAWATGAGGILEAAIALAPWMLRIRNGLALNDPRTANVARDRFNQVQILLERRIRLGRAVDVLQDIRATVHAILIRDGDPVSVLVRYRQVLEDARLRCGELCTCAFDQAAILNMTEWLRSRRPTLRIDITALSQAEGLLAWGLRAVPA